MTVERAQRLGQCLVIMLLAVPAVGCSGGSATSPTAPTGDGSVVSLATPWGTIPVQTGGLWCDPEEALASIEEGYEKARRQLGGAADAIRLDGYRIVIMPEDWHLNGEHVRDRRELRVRAGVERVLEHELQHLFAWELGRSGDCRTYQDHPGGFDLLCRPL